MCTWQVVTSVSVHSVCGRTCRPKTSGTDQIFSVAIGGICSMMRAQLAARGTWRGRVASRDILAREVLSEVLGKER